MKAALFLLYVLGCQVGDSAEEDLALIRNAKKAAREWRASLQSARFRAYVDLDPEGKVARDTKTVGVKRRTNYDWAWTADGNYRYQIWHGSGDGRNDRLPEPTSPPIIMKWSPLVPPDRGLLFQPIAGFWISKPGMWFADAIEQSGRYKVVRRDGKAFVEFEVKRGDRRDRLQVDPEHGFLPVRFLIGDDWQYDVDEWERQGGDRWSPKAGRLSMGMKTGKASDVEKWRIVSAEYDGAFPEDFFTPPPTPHELMLAKLQEEKREGASPLADAAVGERTFRRNLPVLACLTIVGIWGICAAIRSRRPKRDDRSPSET